MSEKLADDLSARECDLYQTERRDLSEKKHEAGFSRSSGWCDGFCYGPAVGDGV
jgi:hypothetical protein